MIYTVMVLTIIFISIIISKFIVNPDLQYIYWLVVFLLFVSVSNIYMTMYYYVKLRNDPGIKGERGDPGEKGIPGSDGVCEINTSCNAVQNCRALIKKRLMEKMPEYKAVIDKRDIELQTLNENDKNIINQVNGFISILEPKCKSGRYTREEMEKLIDDSFKN